MTLSLVHRYSPRGACKDALECRNPEVLLSGPAGTGKSRAALEKLHLMALKYPGMRGLMVRKTAVSLTSTALVTWKTHVVSEALTAGLLEWFGGSPQESAGYRYRNGSRINVGGMDKPTRIMSSEYDAVYVQEAIELTETDWESITTRLRNGVIPYQQLIADTNPDTPTHWLKLRCDSGTTTMLESRHEDNPVLFNADATLTEGGAEYISKLDNLTGVRKHRLRHGKWVAAEGVIYEEWDSAVHLIDPFEPPASWTRWWAVDFGYTNPFVLQQWAEDPDGRLYLYREFYQTRRLVEDHARDVLSVVLDDEGNWIEPKPRGIVCDHDAEDRATLERHLNRSTIAAQKTVSDGIQATAKRMQIAGDGKPRIYVMRNCVWKRDPDLVDSKRPLCTAEEIPGYVWDITDGKPPKEVPIKDNDHGCDAMRYVVAERQAGRPRVRIM